MDEDWQSQPFRQNMMAKINEMLQNTNQDSGKNPTVMENQIFKKARTKEEYLGLVAKLYMHLKEHAQRKQQPQQKTEITQQNMMQDPLNALQNLASQGNRNPQIMASGPNPNQMGGGGVGPVAASNLLQSLNQQRPGGQQGIRGQMPNVVVPGGGPGQQMVPQMGGPPMNTGMQMNVLGGGGQQQQQQMGGMNQMGAGGQGSSGIVPNQIQMNASQLAGGPMNVNTMNVQQIPQMQQMNQNQINMGMNHPQLNQIMSQRMNQVGPNAGPQGIQSMQIHPNNLVGGGLQGQQVGTAVMPNAGQPGNLNQMLNMPPNMQSKPNMPMGQVGQMFPINRGVPGGQQQFLRQSPSPSTVPSPAVGMCPTQVQLQQQQMQQQGGLAGPNQHQPLTPQMQNPQMIPSPALVPTSSPQMSNLLQNNQRNMRQSPSAPLNTPGQVASNSPFNPQEDILYREKYKQLTKYIEPLKRMVAKIGTDSTNSEKITKMSKLLEILSNPNQRVSLETLLKCEKALEKMEIVSYSGQQFGKSSNPLLEVINTTLQSPLANHTLYRTFRPSLELLFGTDICTPSPGKQLSVSNANEKSATQFEHIIPHVLQGEIARLDQKFKVSLDTTAQCNTKTIKLICCFDDKRLPSVPPVGVNIPLEYPFQSPECSLTEQEYMATPFLQSVQNALVSRIAKLPKCYSLTHLLDTWEMSVRQACSPPPKKPEPIEIITID